MTIEQLRTVHHADPFRPFTIHLADGRKFLVPHRDFLSHSPTGRTIIVDGLDDSFSIIDLLRVSELEVHSASPIQMPSS
jgi:hypothetical protein